MKDLTPLPRALSGKEKAPFQNAGGLGSGFLRLESPIGEPRRPTLRSGALSFQERARGSGVRSSDQAINVRIRGAFIPAVLAVLTTAACNPKTAIEVGGGSDSFVPIVDGSVVSIVCGPQGGQHIWTSVRTETLNPLDANAVVTIVDDTGATVCHEELDGVLLLANGSWNEFDGIRCFVSDPNAADGHHATLTGTLTDNTGKHASASVTFTITGPGEDCADQ